MIKQVCNYSEECKAAARANCNDEQASHSERTGKRRGGRKLIKNHTQVHKHTQTVNPEEQSCGVVLIAIGLIRMAF